MAVITFRELLTLITNDPRYVTEWMKDVSAETSLKIRFGTGTPPLDSREFAIVDGSELIIKLDRDGRVLSIEIM